MTIRAQSLVTVDLLPWIYTLAWILAILFALMLLDRSALRRCPVRASSAGRLAAAAWPI